MTIQVEFFDEEHRMEISWDPDDHLESMLNDWTEETFLNHILSVAEDTINNSRIQEPND